jgi:hypothetical protein
VEGTVDAEVVSKFRDLGDDVLKCAPSLVGVNRTKNNVFSFIS